MGVITFFLDAITTTKSWKLWNEDDDESWFELLFIVYHTIKYMYEPYHNIYDTSNFINYRVKQSSRFHYAQLQSSSDTL